MATKRTSSFAPPRGLRVHRVADRTQDGDELIVIDFPLSQSEAPPQLTPAEKAVYERLLAGDSYQDIADVRGTSVRTVANQVASIFGKLGVGSRAELIARTIK